jgi:hypothetical protein
LKILSNTANQFLPTMEEAQELKTPRSSAFVAAKFKNTRIL